MDKVKEVVRFVWQHRFWFCLGLAIIFAASIRFTGVTSLRAATDLKKGQLDSVYKAAEKFKSPPNKYANAKWVERAKEVESKEAASVNATAESLYASQAPLFTWPEVVAEPFKDLPFGADLAFDGNNHLYRYRQFFPEQILEVFKELNAIVAAPDGSLSGIVNNNFGIVTSALWATTTPSSTDAWLAQEELWIQRAIFKAIASANKDATGWSDAPVRQILALNFGSAAIGDRDLAKGKSAVGHYQAKGDPEAKGSPLRSAGKVRRPVAERYLVSNDQFRDIPISLSLVVDQRRIPTVLAALSNADFRFNINQVSAGVPANRITPPTATGEALIAGKAAVRDDAAFNSFVMDVRGVMRIYEMPASMRPAAKKEGEAKAADPKATESKPAEKPAEAKATDSTAGASKSAEKTAAPGDAKAEAKPAAAEAKPAEAKPAPAESKAEEKKAETKPAQGESKETKSE